MEGKLDPLSLTYVEVLLYLGVSAYFAARDARLGLDESLLKKLYDSLYTIFRTIAEVDEKIVTITGRLEALIAKLEGLLKIGATSEVSRKLEVEPTAYELLDALNRILEEIQRLADKEVVVLVDGLDKVSYAVGKALFERSTILVQPHCKAVYAIPLALAFSVEFPQIKRFYDGRRTLPNIRVNHRDGTPDKEGRDFLRQVLQRRMGDHLITTEAMEMLIAASGGVLRDLIEFAQNACSEALAREAHRIEREDVRRTLSDFRRDYHRTLRPQHYEALRQVYASHEIADAGDLADELVYNLTILEYANDEDWYDVHPLVAELLEKRSG